MSKYEFSTQMTKFVRLSPEMIKTKELFASTAPNKLRLSAKTAVLQTSSCPKTKLTGIQECWWAFIKSGFVPCICPHVAESRRCKLLVNQRHQDDDVIPPKQCSSNNECNVYLWSSQDSQARRCLMSNRRTAAAVQCQHSHFPIFLTFFWNPRNQG